MRCPRCDWQSDPELLDDLGQPVRSKVQLAVHAREMGHPSCVVCSLVLAREERVTCERCITAARQVLADVVSLWEELPRHLSALGGSLGRPGGGGRSAGDGRPLPGGDALVLLGPGSPGWAEDEETTRDSDPPSVAFDLGWWEADWREHRGDGAARPARLAAAVFRSAGYLEVHTRWAAEQHVGFPDYVHDLALLFGRLERATGRARAEARANAACFDCGGQLVRLDKEEGLEDDVTCQRCRRVYTPAEYALALRATRDSGLSGWVTVRDAAAAASRSVETLESWVKRGLVEVACRVKDHRHLVWWPDVEARASRSSRRSSRRAS